MHKNLAMTDILAYNHIHWLSYQMSDCLEAISFNHRSLSHCKHPGNNTTSTHSGCLGFTQRTSGIMSIAVYPCFGVESGSVLSPQGHNKWTYQTNQHFTKRSNLTVTVPDTQLLLFMSTNQNLLC